MNVASISVTDTRRAHGGHLRASAECEGSLGRSLYRLVSPLDAELKMNTPVDARAARFPRRLLEAAVRATRRRGLLADERERNMVATVEALEDGGGSASER